MYSVLKFKAFLAFYCVEFRSFYLWIAIASLVNPCLEYRLFPILSLFTNITQSTNRQSPNEMQSIEWDDLCEKVFHLLYYSTVKKKRSNNIYFISKFQTLKWLNAQLQLWCSLLICFFFFNFVYDKWWMLDFIFDAPSWTLREIEKKKENRKNEWFINDNDFTNLSCVHYTSFFWSSYFEGPRSSQSYPELLSN